MTKKVPIVVVDPSCRSFPSLVLEKWISMRAGGTAAPTGTENSVIMIPDA
jgi:hypothetical protein